MKDDKEFIEMAHNASQAYIALVYWAFKGKNGLQGEHSEKFHTLEEVDSYVERIAKQQQSSNSSD